MTTLPNDDIPGYIRPPRRRPSAYRDPEFRTVRNWLNIVFMLACVATVVVYFTATGPSGRLWFIGMGMAAVAVKWWKSSSVRSLTPAAIIGIAVTTKKTDN